MLPPFDLVRRLRPIDLVAPLSARALGAGEHALARPAPFAAATAPVSADRTELVFMCGAHRFVGWYDRGTGRTGISVQSARTTHEFRSRRHGRLRRRSPATEVGLSLTGHHVAFFTRHPVDGWTVRARVDLREVAPGLDPHDEETLAGLRVRGPDGLIAGGFGQLGLRDIRFITRTDGSVVHDGARLLLSATHAGPGFFDTGHTGVWALHPETWEFTHRADLFFRREAASGVFGDHATHVLRHEDAWLVATSTWSDFDLRAPTMRAILARTSHDVSRGEHVLDARDLALPTDGLASVGVWDPHLVHDGTQWLVGFVSARKYFRFHPALAAGADLESLTLLGADASRRATEGTTLARLDGRWHVLASDGPHGPRGQRQQYPVFDLAMREVDRLDAPHPSNIPWPTVTPYGSGWLMLGFDGTSTGGGLVGYGTHGDVLVMVSRGSQTPVDGTRTTARTDQPHHH